MQILMQREAAHASVHEIAELECVQFIDSDSNATKTAFQRPWVSEVRTCDDLLRQLRLFRAAATRLRLPTDHERDYDSAETLDEMNANFSELEKELKDMQTRQRTMDGSYAEKLEHRQVLRSATDELAFTSTLQRPAQPAGALEEEGTGLLEEGSGLRPLAEQQGPVRMIWGVVEMDKREALVCMSVCMYLCVTCMYVCMCGPPVPPGPPGPPVPLALLAPLVPQSHTYIHTYIHTCIHTYMHTYVRTYMHTNIHTNIHAYIRTCIHTYMHTCMHAYIHTHPPTYTHTHT